MFMLLKPLIPVLEYIAYYDYIKTELCVNKDKPEMHCDGKCYLAKQMTKANEAEKNTKDSKQISIHITVEICESLPEYFSFYKTCEPKTEVLEYKNSLYAHLRFQRLFRPPIG